jgi:alpha-glucuronidase
VSNLRADLNPVYYHRADSTGIGFDRTSTGSNAVAQYFPHVRDRYASRSAVPDSLLLWFHHVGWTERLSSGLTLWEELVRHYNAGVDTVDAMRRNWQLLRGRVDDARFADVDLFMNVQAHEARWWRDALLLYFQTFSHLPIPPQYEQLAHPLSFYMALSCPANPHKPRCPAVY